MNETRLPVLSLVLRLAEVARAWFIPIVLFFVLDVDYTNTATNLVRIGVGLFAVVHLSFSFFEWRNFTYRFDANMIYVTSGRFVKEEKTISLVKIQSVQENQPLLYRLLNLVELTLDTNANTDAAALSLKGVRPDEVSRIRSLLAEAGETRGVETTPAEQTVLYTVRFQEIVVASLTSLSIFAIVPIIGTILSELDDFIDVEQLYELGSDFVRQASFVVILLLVLFGLLVSVLLGLLVNAVRYGNFVLADRGEKVYVAKGLLNRSSKEIAYVKIQGIRTKTTILRKWLGLDRVELVAAGTEAEKELEAAVIFPFTKRETIDRISRDYFEPFTFTPFTYRLPKRSLFAKLARSSVLLPLIPVSVMFGFGAFSGAALLYVIVVTAQYMSYRTVTFSQEGETIQLQSGVVVIERFKTERKRIEQMVVHASPIQRKFGLCRLSLQTRGGDMRLESIQDLPVEEAERIMSWFSRTPEEEDQHVITTS